MFRFIVEGHHNDSGKIFYLFGYSFRLGTGDICYHHFCRTVGDKLFFHTVKPLSCFGGIRQISGHGIFHFYPVHRYDRKDQGKTEQQKKQISSIHDKGGDFYHHSAVFPVLFWFCSHVDHSLFMYSSDCGIKF